MPNAKVEDKYENKSEGSPDEVIIYNGTPVGDSDTIIDGNDDGNDDDDDDNDIIGIVKKVKEGELNELISILWMHGSNKTNATKV